MVAVRDGDIPVAAVAALAPDHEGHDAREVGLEGHHLHVDHELGVVFEFGGNAAGPLEAPGSSWTRSALPPSGCGARCRGSLRGIR